jgi:dTDP-4-dehydrorhamnose reductase
MAAPWLVTGANGQVGRALLSEFRARGVAAIGVDRSQVDLSRPDELPQQLERLIQLEPAQSLQGILNAAAYNAVDRADTEPELAARVNTEAPAVLARACFERGIPFVHYSTDYVYSGQGSTPWTEEAPVAPLSTYGRTKAQGDAAVLAQAAAVSDVPHLPRPRYLILRTSWVYDAQGENFPRKILARAATQAELKVVNDQIGAPTHARHLAQATLAALSQLTAQNSGVYHACASGYTSWFGFSEALLARARTHGAPFRTEKITPVSSEAFPTPAQRPRNSRLSLDKLERTFDIHMPDWIEGLDQFFSDLFFKESKPGN